MKYFILLFIFVSSTVFADDKDSVIIVPIQDRTLKLNETTGMIENLTYKTIKDIMESSILGNLVDIHLPNKLINCYIFHFKKETTIYQIAALPENGIPETFTENFDLTQFIAIGYYGILNPDKEEYSMFGGPGEKTPFDTLHKINPRNYVSISEIEIMLGIDFILFDKGGFISPFYLYRCNLENGILSILASPSKDKTKSYFMGGWSFVQNGWKLRYDHEKERGSEDE